MVTREDFCCLSELAWNDPTMSNTGQTEITIRTLLQHSRSNQHSESQQSDVQYTVTAVSNLSTSSCHDGPAGANVMSRQSNYSKRRPVSRQSSGVAIRCNNNIVLLQKLRSRKCHANHSLFTVHCHGSQGPFYGSV